MKCRVLALSLVLLAGCATREVRCDGTLVPINAARSEAASATSPKPSPGTSGVTPIVGGANSAPGAVRNAGAAR